MFIVSLFLIFKHKPISSNNPIEGTTFKILNFALLLNSWKIWTDLYRNKKLKKWLLFFNVLINNENNENNEYKLLNYK